MGRPPMPVGTYGKIKDFALPDGRHMARCKFRDYDGEVRLVSRTAGTKTAAENALKSALLERQGRGGVGITRDLRLAALADIWLAEVEGSDLSIGTKQHYRYVANTYVRPAVGALRIAEATVGPLDRALIAVRTTSGKGAAKSMRSVLSGMLGLAARHDVIAWNPVRDTSPIKETRKPIRSLTRDETDELCDALRSSERAVDLDLPDLVEFMLATGCRIGEACAAREAVNSEGKKILDLDAGTFEVNATIVRITGKGLIVQERPKTAAGWRVLALPPFAVEMVRRRQNELRLQGPSGVIFGSPSSRSLRDPSNTPGDLRKVIDRIGLPDDAPKDAVGPYSWVTSHVFRKTVATRLDEAGLTARQIADQLGHARPSLTQDRYMGRQVVNAAAAHLLNR